MALKTRILAILLGGSLLFVVVTAISWLIQSNSSVDQNRIVRIGFPMPFYEDDRIRGEKSFWFSAATCNFLIAVAFSSTAIAVWLQRRQRIPSPPTA